MKNQLFPPASVSALPRPRPQGVGVIGPVNEIARAFRTGHHRGPGARADGRLVFLLRDRDHGERNRGIRQVHDDIDIFGIEPSARDRRADVGLVLMVRGDDFDRHAERLREVVHGELSGDDRAHALVVGVDARHVIEDADLERAGILRAERGRRQRHRRARQAEPAADWAVSPLPFRPPRSAFPCRVLGLPVSIDCGPSGRPRQESGRRTSPRTGRPCGSARGGGFNQRGNVGGRRIPAQRHGRASRGHPRIGKQSRPSHC